MKRLILLVTLLGSAAFAGQANEPRQEDDPNLAATTVTAGIDVAGTSDLGNSSISYSDVAIHPGSERQQLLQQLQSTSFSSSAK